MCWEKKERRKAYRLQTLYIKKTAMSEDFVKVAETKDIQAAQMKEVEVAGESICVSNVDGKYYAIGNICTHVGGPLDQGTLEGYEVECPWHGSKFDVRTGEPTKPPARSPEPTYEAKVEGDNVLIRKRK
jgi:3-phenylpropionate/trans-cinnamate dioxygenase ferredoxin component